MALTEIQKLRRDAGDNDPEFQYLSDEDYQQLIDDIPSKRKLSKHIDMLILNMKANDIHERSGQEERWGNQLFENGLKMVKLKWKDPAFSGTQGLPSFGGTSRTEMSELATDPDRVPDTFYKGDSKGRAEWQEVRIYRYCGRAFESNGCLLVNCYGIQA